MLLKNFIFENNYYPNKALEKKYNYSGRNNSKKIVIRFRSKNQYKKIISLDNLKKKSQISLYGHQPNSPKRICSNFIDKKRILFLLGLRLKTLSFQFTSLRIKNFIFFIKRLLRLTNKNLKLRIALVLNSLKKEIVVFQHLFSQGLIVSNTIHTFDFMNINKFDINYIKNYSQNSFVSNIVVNRKKFFVSPSSKGYILYVNSSYCLILSPKDKILKIPATSTAQLSSVNFLTPDKLHHKKASSWKRRKKGKRVLGKSMNVCDHPNGGYKRASKLLKDFRSVIIKK